MARPWRLLIVLGLLPVVGVLAWRSWGMQADEPHPGLLLPRENKALHERLDFARKLAADKKWSEAIEAYAAILRDVGDKLSPEEKRPDAAFFPTRSLQLRLHCHLDIAAFSKSALKQYRTTVKAQTRKWLDEGVKNRDEQPLLRVVREAFCSEAGEHALDSLGDLAFERGDFQQAIAWWQPLVPAPGAGGSALRYPEPKGDVARICAKIILAQLFDGQEQQAQSEFKRFAESHGKSEGHLAGEDGNLVAILKKWLDRGPPDFGRDKSWPTFAGTALRNGAPSKLPHHRLWSDGPAWTATLVEPAKAANPPQPVPLAEQARQLAFHPVIVDQRVLVANGQSVFLFDLFGGQKLDSYHVPAKLYVPPKETAGKHLPRYTLTAADGKVFVVLGDQRIAPARNGERTATKSYLFCLDLAGKDAANLSESWHVRAEEGKAEAAVFEGTPVVDHDRVYIHLTRARGLQLTSLVCCFDMHTGRQLWQEELAQFTEAEEDRPPPVVDVPMLTLAGNRLVSCSQRGVIQALDPWNGTQCWAVRYPARGAVTIEGTPSPRELCPCLYADGRLYAAPMDSDRLLCLDAQTGQVHWERDRIQVVHLLRCDADRLLFSTPDGVRAVDAANGSDKRGWLQPTSGRLPPFGRGLVLGDWFFWPTQHPQYSLRAVSVATGGPYHDGLTFSPVQLRHIKPGNMAYANGCLVVAGDDQLFGYVAPKHLLKQRQKDAAVPKPAPQSLYKLAQSEADAGLVEDALKHFKAAEKAIDPSAWEGELLQWKCLTERHDLLMTTAAAQRGAVKAAPYLLRATSKEFPVDWRLRALFTLTERWEKSDEDLYRALLLYQSILNDEELREGTYFGFLEIISLETASAGRLPSVATRTAAPTAKTPGHRSLRARNTAATGSGPTGPGWDKAKRIAARRIEYLRQHGGEMARKAYKDIEAKASQSFPKKIDGSNAAAAEKLLWQFPNSEAARRTRQKLVAWHKQHRQFGAAAALLHDEIWLALNNSSLGFADEESAFRGVLMSLGETYEESAGNDVAYCVWQAVPIFFTQFIGAHTLLNGVGQRELAELQGRIAKKLAQPKFDAIRKSVGKEEAIPNLAIPVAAEWDAKAGGLLTVQSPPPHLQTRNLFFTAQSNQFVCHHCADGKRAWSTSLPFVPTWIGCVDDIVIAVGRLGVAGLRMLDGHIAWAWTSMPGGSTCASPFPDVDETVVLDGFFLGSASDGTVHLFIPSAAMRIDPATGKLYPTSFPFELGESELPPAGEAIPRRMNRAAYLKNALCFATAGSTIHRTSNSFGDLDYYDVIESGLEPTSLPYELFKFDRGSDCWLHKPRLPTTLTGEMPRVFAHQGKFLLALLPRNYGYDLERLDPKTGANVWKPAARLCDQPFERDAVAFHDGAVYYASGNHLFARNLENGDLLWKRDLPKSVRGWRVKATKQALMVFPGAMDEPTVHTLPFGSFALTIPVRKRPKYPFCLQAHGYQDGKLLQRLEFEGDVAGAGIQFFPDLIVVTAGQKAYGLRGKKAD